MYNYIDAANADMAFIIYYRLLHGQFVATVNLRASESTITFMIQRITIIIILDAPDRPIVRK
jgi:hypothetical protein